MDLLEDDQIVTQVANGTMLSGAWSFLPSSQDLLFALPRAAVRGVGLLADSYDIFESLFIGDIRERTVAAATGRAGGNMIAAGAGAGAAAADHAANGGAMSYLRAFNVQQLRTFGGIFNYLISKWALCCFLVAIILNRTSVYAATRRNLQLKWPSRMLMRAIPSFFLVAQIQNVLRGIRCQTSPDFSLMRYGVEDKLVHLDFSQDGGFLYKMSSAVLLGEDDEASCRAVKMIPDDMEDDRRPDGSLSLLWPAFKSLCFSKFIEVLSSTVQGLPAGTETGMSLFEHSLAYAETESMIGNLIGIGPMSSQSKNGTNNMVDTVIGSNAGNETVYLTRDFVLTKFNTSPEVLLITLISLCNSVSSHILGIAGKQAQFRLLSTGIWGVCFLGCFVWAFNSFSVENVLDSGIFRFPTVCVVGFFPHLLIVAGIVLCAVIYFMALFLAVLSPPRGTPPYTSWSQRFAAMYENMQINMQLQNVRINMREDFYTALLRLGLSTLTAASEAVFLNEGRHINLGPRTWLEEERMSQMMQSRGRSYRKSTPPVDANTAADAVASGVQLKDTAPQGLLAPEKWQSGYARERTTTILKSNGSLRQANDGVGTLQRHNRFSMAFGFAVKILRLVFGWLVLMSHAILEGLGIQYRPAWMMRILEGPKPKTQDGENAKPVHSQEFWVIGEHGELKRPTDSNLDVETEMRKRLRTQNPQRAMDEEDSEIESRLYNWFTSNGWWGDKDDSGEWVPPSEYDDDEDTTSVISMSTNASEWEDEDDEEGEDGRTTPTQKDPYSTRRESTSLANEALSQADLVRLLDPRDLESRSEARILAKHLGSEGVVTRSRFRASLNNDGTHLLTSDRFNRPPGFTPAHVDGRLSDQEEAEILEFLILKARKEKLAHSASTAHHATTSTDDAFSGGPQCVVCQGAPRTIMAWPCRCLSLCDDCRVNLAMNNFANCACCRQEVVGFSRLFVP